jgi:hypothetical protein
VGTVISKTVQTKAIFMAFVKTAPMRPQTIFAKTMLRIIPPLTDDDDPDEEVVNTDKRSTDHDWEGQVRVGRA